MSSTLTTSEEAQLGQTIEMFEVITQSQPHDYQSLEILKEAYSKLGREEEAIATSKRIAEAYVQMGQISSAILEYETILQRIPDDQDVKQALLAIESKSGSFSMEGAPSETSLITKKPGLITPQTTSTGNGMAPGGVHGAKNGKPAQRVIPKDCDDGRRSMQKIFVGSKAVAQADFDKYWPKHDFSVPLVGVIEPFIQILADKGVVPLEKSLKLMCDHSRFAYLPLNSYDIDIDLARTFPADTCQRWCLLPFDRMSKCILVATTNPFNQQAAQELSEATPNRLLWYVVSPTDLVKNVRKAFR